MESGSQLRTTSQGAETVVRGSLDLDAIESGIPSDQIPNKDLATQSDDIQTISSTAKSVALIASVLSSMFLVGLDRTIISTVRIL